MRAQRRSPPTRLLVLPFRQLVEDPETSFLAFSVPDALVTALSGLSSLVVRPSAVAARFGGHAVDLKAIAAEADVNTLVTGTLLRSRDQIRITAQLASVPDGDVLWSQPFQFGLGETFALQDRLVTTIVDALSLVLTSGDTLRLQAEAPRSPAAYEYFLRGNAAIGPHAIASAANLRVALDLYKRSIDEDDGFAPAWVRLGRCHYLSGKFDEHHDGRHFIEAERCLQRGLALNPELPLAHDLFALVEIDQGRARDAMARLIARGLAGSVQPELYASLVQACRFCGLYEASLAAHERARELDATIATSVYHTLFQLGDMDRALRETVRAPILNALVVGMRGDTSRAIAMLREREAGGPTPLLMHLMACIRSVFEGQRETAIEHAQPIFAAFPDPEFVFYAARSLAYFGEARAIEQCVRALDRGFVLYRVLSNHDPWLDPIRPLPAFRALLERAHGAYRQSIAAYTEAGGATLLGSAGLDATAPP
jgi:TolB-like protein